MNPAAPRPLRSLGLLVASGVAAVLLAMPTSTMASTGPTVPPPSVPPCALGASTIVAGTPLAVSGIRTTTDAVGMMAARVDNRDKREIGVATVGSTWRAVLLFGAADGGSWVIELGVDGATCQSSLEVTLPEGVIAPPTQAPVAEPGPSTGELVGETVRTAASLTVVGAVLASWIFMAVYLLSLRSRARTHRGVRVVARIAAFISVIGACYFVAFAIYFFVSISHFDSGIPPDQKALLDGGLWLAGILGSMLGTLAATRIRGRASTDAS